MADPKKKNESSKTKREGRKGKGKKAPPPKKKRLVLKVLVLGVFAVLGTWMGLYSFQLGKGPWGWSGEDWGGFVTFSQQQVSEAASTASDALEGVDWEAIKDSITEHSKELYGKVTGWDEKLDERLAKLKEVEGEGGEAGEPGPDGEPAAATEPSKPMPQYKLDYADGGEKLREAMRVYKKSFPKGGNDSNQDALQRELRKAKGLFREAHELLSKAMDGAEEAGDANLAREIEEAVVVCGQYLQDCSKREMAR